MTISDDERRQREDDVRQARASAALEGFQADPVTLDLQDRWARGEITAEEMTRLLREAFGVPPLDPR